MENHCIFCGSIIPEGRQICKNCEVKAMNKEGYPDPTAERAVHNASRIPKNIWSISLKISGVYIECSMRQQASPVWRS